MNHDAPLLIGEIFSPWSRKAAWMLGASGIAFQFRHYTPLLSELRLRLTLREWSTTVSVPALLTKDATYRDSWSIAGYAHANAKTPWPAWSPDIAVWNDLSDLALAECRMDALAKLARSRVALMDSMPPWTPHWLRPALTGTTQAVVLHLRDKYQHVGQPGATRHALRTLRAALSQSNGLYVQGSFSYIDICMATLVEVVDPDATSMPTATVQACWAQPSLCDEFRDLLAWRKKLAQLHPLPRFEF